MLDRRVSLGDIADALVGNVLPAAISAGGQIGAAVITAGADQDVAKQQTKAALLTQLSNERIALASTQADQAVASQGIGTGGKVLLVLGVLWFLGRD